MIRLIALVLLWATGASAFEYPAIFKVVNVEDHDHLHVRANPDASAVSLGSFESSSSGIEVVRLSEDGAWGQVNYGEQSAWVSMRYLERTSALSGPYPSVRCFGNEPFWSFKMDVSSHRSTAVFDEIGQQETRLQITQYAPSENQTDRVLFVAGLPRTGTFSHLATVSEAQCSDEMSDRVYGLSLDLVIFAGGPDRYISGCCSLSPN